MDWTEPGAEEVAPGVHRIALPLPSDALKAVNVYAIVGESSTSLVDGGWRIDEARTALDTALTSLGLAAQDIDRCLVTHHHRDHYTMAVDLRRRVGLTVSLGEGERANIASALEPHRAFGEQRALLSAAGAHDVLVGLDRLVGASPSREDYEAPDDWLEDDQVIDLSERRLRVRATPGHTSGHVVFVDEAAGLLFAGDHVLPHITPSIGFQAVLAKTPLADYLGSLALILEEPDRLLLPAHGPAGGSAHARTHELLAHHETRLAQTESVVRAGASTAYEAARALRWTRRERTLDELDPFNQMLAVSETVAHLDVLCAEDRITVRDGDGMWRYAAGA